MTESIGLIAVPQAVRVYYSRLRWLSRDLKAGRMGGECPIAIHNFPPIGLDLNHCDTFNTFKSIYKSICFLSLSLSPSLRNPSLPSCYPT